VVCGAVGVNVGLGVGCEVGACEWGGAGVVWGWVLKFLGNGWLCGWGGVMAVGGWCVGVGPG